MNPPLNRKSIRPLLAGLALLTLAALVLFWGRDSSARISTINRPLPEFQNQSQDHWINSKPLKTADLKGKVVLIEVWTSI